jgi:hypothetical protein
MSNFKTVAYLTPGHPLFLMFPDGEVPVTSFIPQVSELSSEPFLWVDGSLLNDWQINLFVGYVLSVPTKSQSSRETLESCVRTGFPLLYRFFCGGRTEDLDVMLSALEEILEDSEDSGGLEKKVRRYQ